MYSKLVLYHTHHGDFEGKMVNFSMSEDPLSLWCDKTYSFWVHSYICLVNFVLPCIIFTHYSWNLADCGLVFADIGNGKTYSSLTSPDRQTGRERERERDREREREREGGRACDSVENKVRQMTGVWSLSFINTQG